jgi:sarcosine oxidase subunit gamma
MQTAFASRVAALSKGEDGLTVLERTGLGIATVMARAGQVPALGQRLGMALVDGPVRSAAEARAMLGTGPGTWLMIAENVAPDWAERIADDMAGLASVFDQSSGYAILRLSGAEAAAVLRKGAFLDFHVDAFPPGSVAVAVIEHIGAILWRLDETVFEIVVFRSFASSFWHWLVTAAASIGVPLRAAG